MSTKPAVGVEVEVDAQSARPKTSKAPLATTPNIISLLSDPDALAKLDVEKIQQLVALDSEMRAERARVEFAVAMNGVQSRMTPVARRGVNTHTQSRYAFAQDVEKMLMPLLVKEGFSVGGSTEPSHLPDHLRFVLRVRHNSGHEEEHKLDAPIDDKGAKGAPTKTRLHGMGSTLTYCHRYLLCLVFEVQLSRDDDGNAGGNVGPSAEAISAAQKTELSDAGNNAAVDWELFYSHFAIAAISDLPRSRFNEAMALIAAKLRHLEAAS